MSEATLKFMAAVHETLTFLDALADKLDRWAIASRQGGWSTHQVAANEMAANDCRRAAAKLRAAIIIEEHGRGCVMTARPEREADALDLAGAICRFAGELNDAAESVFMAHRDASIAPPVPLSVGYSRDVANRLLAALDAYEART